MFADTVTMMLANGTLCKRESRKPGNVKEYRGSIKNYKVTVDAWMSMKSLDRNENVVCVWGNENFTDKDGKRYQTTYTGSVGI